MTRSTPFALAAVLLLCTGGPLAGAAASSPPPAGHPLTLLHRAQAVSSGAEVSLVPLDDPARALAGGAAADWRARVPDSDTVLVLEFTASELERVLEIGAGHFGPYTFEAGRDLFAGGSHHLLIATGVDYEIDLTRPAGDRITGLAREGRSLPAEARIRTAVASSVAAATPILRDARRIAGRHPTVGESLDAWTRGGGAAPRHPALRLLPDYALEPERPLIDLLVRRGVVDTARAKRLGAAEPAARGDLAYWLARAFGWRASRPSNAFGDVPDSLAPWLDGLLERRVLGSFAAHDAIQPFTPLALPLALDWCERAAKSSGLRTGESFRRSLLTGVSRVRGGGLTRAAVLALVANTRYPQIRVLETTDFHGAILPGARERRTDRPVGGSAVLAAWIEKLRAENPEGTVLLDGGDCFQGTMISNLAFGRPVVEQMNALRYTAFAVGNHEFDWTADTLERRVREMEFAALAANMKERRGHRLPRWVRADTQFVRRGVDVGVVGLAYRNTPSVTLARHVAHLAFEDDSAAAARAVPRLRRAGADLVLGVGHVPAESDTSRRARRGDLVRLARGVAGVNAWFGGHSHNQVVDEVNGVPVMIAGSHGQVVAVCDLVWDPVARRVAETHTRLQPTYADEVTPDSAMAARVARWNAGIEPLAEAELGRAARTLTRNRNRESALGNFVTDAIRAAAQVDVALQNSGGLRADLPQGVITKRTVFEVLPFENTVVTMELTGAEIRRVFEEGLRFGRVAQLSGVRIAFDADRPALDRVVSLTLADGSPLDPARTYRVAVNNFMATGGDNYDTLARGRNVVDTGLMLRDLVEQRVIELARRGEAVDAVLDGRIERLGSTPPPRDDR